MAVAMRGNSQQGIRAWQVKEEYIHGTHVLVTNTPTSSSGQQYMPARAQPAASSLTSVADRPAAIQECLNLRAQGVGEGRGFEKTGLILCLPGLVR